MIPAEIPAEIKQKTQTGHVMWRTDDQWSLKVMEWTPKEKESVAGRGGRQTRLGDRKSVV